MKKTTFVELLHKVGLKKTKHRLLILDLLHQHEDFMSADDLFFEAKKVDASISLSTVYRMLESFVEKNIVTPISLETSNQLKYELTHKDHTHHLICTNCHKVIHVAGCPIDTYEDKLEATYGFHVEKHKLEFYGLCETCQAK